MTCKTLQVLSKYRSNKIDQIIISPANAGSDSDSDSIDSNVLLFINMKNEHRDPRIKPIFWTLDKNAHYYARSQRLFNVSRLSTSYISSNFSKKIDKNNDNHAYACDLAGDSSDAKENKEVYSINWNQLVRLYGKIQVITGYDSVHLEFEDTKYMTWIREWCKRINTNRMHKYVQFVTNTVTLKQVCAENVPELDFEYVSEFTGL